MLTISKACAGDASLLADLGRQTFLESHGHSASPEIIASYVAEKYTVDVMSTELSNPQFIYHIAYWNTEAIGFTKIIPDSPHENVPAHPVAKLERIYVLEAHFPTRAGQALLDHAVQWAQAAGQKGLWLFTWKKNARAIRFYEKNRFITVGTYDFHLSPEHANPNWQLFLAF